MNKGSELNSEQREILKQSLLETQALLTRTLERLEGDKPLTLLDTLYLMMEAVQPVHNGVQEEIVNKLTDIPISPVPAIARANYVEDAYTLREVATKIAATVLDQGAFKAAREAPSNLDDLIETALVACINLGDFVFPTWPRVRREHLIRGYEIVAAGRYVLRGEVRSGEIIEIDNLGSSQVTTRTLPADIENFPQFLELRDED